MMAIVFALERFRIYLQGIPFTIVTDYKAVKMALNKKEINNRLNRWFWIQQGYVYKMEHRSGERMQHIVVLSRNLMVIKSLSFDRVLVCKQLQDPDIQKVHRELENAERLRCELRNGVLYRKINRNLMFFVLEAMLGLPSIASSTRNIN